MPVVNKPSVTAQMMVENEVIDALVKVGSVFRSEHVFQFIRERSCEGVQIHATFITGESGNTDPSRFIATGEVLAFGHMTGVLHLPPYLEIDVFNPGIIGARGANIPLSKVLCIFAVSKSSKVVTPTKGKSS